MTDARGDSSDEWTAIDHVQLAIPVGAEDEARAFYVGVLGLDEVPKPDVMARRGGAWFEAGAVRLHVGAEAGFVPASKAHPALVRRDLQAFLDERGLCARWNSEIEGLLRCHIDDPFGNRIELIDAATLNQTRTNQTRTAQTRTAQTRSAGSA